jgi:hypothetical protein
MKTGAYGSRFFVQYIQLGSDSCVLGEISKIPNRYPIYRTGTGITKFPSNFSSPALQLSIQSHSIFNLSLPAIKYLAWNA